MECSFYIRKILSIETSNQETSCAHKNLMEGGVFNLLCDSCNSVWHSFSFKLTDFGASRELQQDETFQSYYGTEEYLVSYLCNNCKQK